MIYSVAAFLFSHVEYLSCHLVGEKMNISLIFNKLKIEPKFVFVMSLAGTRILLMDLDLVTNVVRAVVQINFILNLHVWKLFLPTWFLNSFEDPSCVILLKLGCRH